MKRKFNKINKVHIKKGDMVKVIAGNSKGSQGRVLEVNPANNTAIVEQANVVSKHTKPNAQNTQGGIVKKEAPINLSNLMILDPSQNVATRIGRKLVDGQWVRYAKKSGEEIK
ncbi:MAG TPA: 50S ribosomal protein L24 [Bacteroidia bacterium]|nr:50S ribosomal protein L24 [Bacteroidia bacterium]HNT80241.1 50S ribosomal protein L24 [Bacteroidia bacterium]